MANHPRRCPRGICQMRYISDWVPVLLSYETVYIRLDSNLLVIWNGVCQIGFQSSCHMKQHIIRLDSSPLVIQNGIYQIGFQSFRCISNSRDIPSLVHYGARNTDQRLRIYAHPPFTGHHLTSISATIAVPFHRKVCEGTYLLTLIFLANVLNPFDKRLIFYSKFPIYLRTIQKRNLGR